MTSYSKQELIEKWLELHPQDAVEDTQNLEHNALAGYKKLDGGGFVSLREYQEGNNGSQKGQSGETQKLQIQRGSQND